MTINQVSSIDLAELESQLLLQEDERQKLILLDRLAGHYVLTNAQKAQEILSEEWEILKDQNFPDFKLAYHLNTAFIQNQLYNFDLAAIHYQQGLEILEESPIITMVYVSLIWGTKRQP